MVANKSRARKKKRKSDDVKMEMLAALADGKVYTFSALSRKLATGYATVVSNSAFLVSLGFVRVETIGGVETASGKDRSTVRITKNGKSWLDGFHRRKGESG